MGKGLWKSWRRHKREFSHDDYLARQEARGFTDDGQLMDPTPVAPPIGYKKQPSMVDHLREMVRSELLARDLARQGVETFDEADDFGADDEDEAGMPPLSGYEAEFDPPAVQRIVEAASQAARSAAAREREASRPPAAPEPPTESTQE